MEKTAGLFGLFGAVLALAACGNQQAEKAANTSKNTSTAKVSKANKSNTLILYFSLTGTTQGAAQYLQKQTGAKLIRLQPQKAYGDYDAAARREDYERRHNIHPALATKIPNFKSYQTVLIGYPTWWSCPPMIIHTLFARYNFRGKTRWRRKTCH